MSRGISEASKQNRHYFMRILVYTSLLNYNRGIPMMHILRMHQSDISSNPNRITSRESKPHSQLLSDMNHDTALDDEQSDYLLISHWMYACTCIPCSLFTCELLINNQPLCIQEIPKCIQSLCIKIAFVLYRLVPVQPLGVTTCRFPTPMQHKFYPSYNISDVI